MTGKERIQTTLNHKQPDKVAVDFGGTCDSTMHVSCIAGLREYYGLKKQPVTVQDVFTMAGTMEEEDVYKRQPTVCLPPEASQY